MSTYDMVREALTRVRDELLFRKAAAELRAIRHRLDRLFKGGFDPNEPRDESGEWTSSGGSTPAGQGEGSGGESPKPATTDRPPRPKTQRAAARYRSVARRRKV